MSRQIPSIALTHKRGYKKTPISEKEIKAHGNTDPEKLELRRNAISAMVKSLERELAASHVVIKTMEGSASPTEQLGAIRLRANLVWQMAMLESMALMIDCMSCREIVKVKLKSGKVVKGVLRVSIASKIHDIEIDSEDISDRLMMIEKAMLQSADEGDEEEKEPPKKDGEEEELPLEEEHAGEVFIKDEDKKQ